MLIWLNRFWNLNVKIITLVYCKTSAYRFRGKERLHHHFWWCSPPMNDRRNHPSIYHQSYVGSVGFEPTTNSLKGNCSTIELRSQCFASSWNRTNIEALEEPCPIRWTMDAEMYFMVVCFIVFMPMRMCVCETCGYATWCCILAECCIKSMLIYNTS